MPEQVYVFIKRVKQIKFDFYVYNENFFILTEKFLQFIQKHGFKEGYEICPAFLVNTGNKSLTNKKFYLMRIPDEVLDKYRDCIEYEEPVGVPRQLGDEDILYKQIYTHLDLKILPFYKPGYKYEGLAIDESLVVEAKETFEMPTIFSPQEWIEINTLDESLLLKGKKTVEEPTTVSPQEEIEINTPARPRKSLYMWATLVPRDMMPRGFSQYFPCPLTEITLSDQSQYKRNTRHHWLNTHQQNPLPEQIYAHISRLKVIKFDFYCYNKDLYLVTDKFLKFAQKYGFTEGYELCPALLVNLKNQPLTDTPFYLLRIRNEDLVRFNSHIVFEKSCILSSKYHYEPLKMYKNMYTTSDFKILPTDEVMEWCGFAVDESLVAEIKETFELPTVFSNEQYINVKKIIHDADLI